jgi:hypothetical protein
MLEELPNTKQLAGEPQRRWFSSNYFDLIVWFDVSQVIIGFQLCYDKDREEKALEWRKAMGYQHYKVQTGEEAKFKLKASPVLVIDGPINIKRIQERFSQDGNGIDKEM